MTTTQSTSAQMLDALMDAKLQIEYLHEKFQETGSGNTILARIESAIAAASAEPAQLGGLTDAQIIQILENGILNDKGVRTYLNGDPISFYPSDIKALIIASRTTISAPAQPSNDLDDLLNHRSDSYLKLARDMREAGGLSSIVREWAERLDRLSGDDPESRACAPVQQPQITSSMETERADFEHWYTCRFDEPIGSNECARQWSAWIARAGGFYKAPSDWKISPQPWGIVSPVQQAGHAPEGWRLVPIEPTPEMLKAWELAPYAEHGLGNVPRTAYRAMIAAAPQPGEKK